MGGFGSIQSMIQSLKMNRDQLRKHRKSHKNLAENYGLKKRQELKFKKFNPGEMKDFKAALALKRKKKERLKLIVILSLVVVGIVAVSLMFI